MGDKKCFACIYIRRKAQYNTGILSSSEQGIARGLTILCCQYPAKNGNYALAAAISSIYL
jgi:hypothetical protein